MQIKRIQELVKLVKDNKSIAELTVEEKGFKFHIKAANRFSSPPPLINNANIPTTPATAQLTPPSVAAPIVKNEKTAIDKNKLNSNRKYIKSPIVGTFYIRPKPDAPPFVKVGDIVKAGKVVCVVESMKLFNEIESDISGRIVEILVKDASPVEYGQELFSIE